MSSHKNKFTGFGNKFRFFARPAGFHANTPITATESYFQLLFVDSPFPAWIIDLATLRFLKVNNAAIALYGYTETEFISMSVNDIRPSEEMIWLEENFKRIRNNEPPLKRTWQHLKKNGDLVYVEIKGNNFIYLGRQSRLVLINDITARINTEANLRKINDQHLLANERYNIIARATHDLVWEWNLETNQLFRDPKGVLEVYGFPEDESIRHVEDWLDRIHPDDFPAVQKAVLDIIHLETEHLFEVEYRFRLADNQYAYIYDRGYILRKNGKAYRMIGAAQNITHRKKLEQEILDQQKVISQATINSQEKERTEISKELHDNVNQLLTTTKLYLDLAATNTALREEMIAKSSANIMNAIAEIRKLSQSLMIPSLGDLGLIDSIGDLAENVSATKMIHVNFIHHQFNETILDENQKLTLFRIIQEGLNNVIKHAEASLAQVKLSCENEVIELIIQDNGKGFDAVNSKKGAGLNNIRNRVYLINGKLTVNTQPGEGCRLVVQLPTRF